MIDVSLNAFKKARLWINQLPDAEFEYLRAIQKNVQSSHEKVICNNEAAIELLINRGAKSEYGLIGAKFFNNGSDTILKVNISDQSNTDFHNSLANSIDTVKRGLPLEFAEIVAEELFKCSNILPSGILTVSHAAHGIVNSNANIFRCCTKILIRLLCEKDISEAYFRQILEQSIAEYEAFLREKQSNR